MASSSSFSFSNVYAHRRVAETKAKPCEICFRPSSSVLITLDNKDFFYVCPSHIKDTGFCTPKIDPVAEEARKQRMLKAEMDKVKAEYEEKMKRKKEEKEKKEKEKEKGKDGKAEKGKDEKEKDKEKEKKDGDEKGKDDEKRDDGKSSKSPAPEDEEEQEEEPRVFELKSNFYQQRLNRKRQAEISKRNRERLQDPQFFPSVPKNLP